MSKTVRSALMSLSLLFFLAWLYGCDDAGLHDTDTPQTDASIDVPAADVMAPTVAITFPGYAALLTEGRITVRGIAQDQSTITRVTVQDSAAQSMDGFATWEATVALPPGTTRLVVSAEDAFGNANAMAATVTVSVVEPLWRSPTGLAVEATGQLVVTDSDLQAVVRLEPQSGMRTIVSDATAGSRPTFLSLQDVAVETTGHLVVIDEFLKAILRVDPLTGVRSIVSDEQHGSGPLFGPFLRSVAVETSGHLVVVDGTVTNGRPIIRVHPLTGSRTIVSDASVGSGPSLVVPRGIAIEMTGELLVVDRVLRAVVRIDPISGDRRILSDDTLGVGPVFSDPVDITVENTEQIVVLDMGLRAIVRVDAQHGDRAIISR